MGKDGRWVAIPYSRTIVGDLPWYSVLVVSGIVLAVWLAGKEEKRLGLPKDLTIDLTLIVVPCGIIGARLYYVLMSWDAFAANPISVLYVWQGGLAIYGGVIGGAIGAYGYARAKKISFAAIADIIAPGLLLAQAVGRWGNYFNMEAYGRQITDPQLHFFPLAVFIPAENAWFAATFFYEFMWNLLGFSALWMLRKKQTRQGNVFAWYLLIYGAGRFVIEQLRTDSLYIGNLRASQWLSLVLCAVAAVILLYRACRQNNAKKYFLSLFCTALWMMRWGVLQNHAIYGVILVSVGIVALWMKRNKRIALVWILCAVLLDGIGLMAAAAGWPVIPAGHGIHAALCSITLPMGVWALCSEK